MKELPKSSADADNPAAKAKHHKRVRRTEARKLFASRAPSDCPHICSAAVAKPSRKKAATRTRFCKIALPARTISPPRAPCDVKKAKAKSSAAVRIKISRLIANI